MEVPWRGLLPAIRPDGQWEQVNGSPIERLADLLHERGLAAGRIGCEWEHYGLTFPPMCTDCSRIGDITEATDYELLAGMVLHISASLRKVGKFGVTMGDTVLVTKTDCETLTKVPAGLRHR